MVSIDKMGVGCFSGDDSQEEAHPSKNFQPRFP